MEMVTVTLAMSHGWGGKKEERRWEGDQFPIFQNRGPVQVLKIDRSLCHLDRSTAVIERGIPVQQAKSRIESFFVQDTQTLFYCHSRLVLQTNQSNRQPQPENPLLEP